jgi:deazaflavin-dependent oxidoreductase (nitroreductase family)
MNSTAFDESKVIDSPVGWVADHIKDYVETDGRKGHFHLSLKAETLLLTVQGRKSGNWHRTALAYQLDGENYVVAASSGGTPKHPTWYLNLSKNPEVHVQVLADKFTARARVAEGEGEERARLWNKLVEFSSDYDRFQAMSGRETPVIVLEPVR